MSEVAIWREASRRAIAERRPTDVKEIAAELRAQAKAAKETAIEFAHDTVRAVKGAKKSIIEAASSLGEAKEEIAGWASEHKPAVKKVGFAGRSLALRCEGKVSASPRAALRVMRRQRLITFVMTSATKSRMAARISRSEPETADNWAKLKSR